MILLRQRNYSINREELERDPRFNDTVGGLYTAGGLGLGVLAGKGMKAAKTALKNKEITEETYKKLLKSGVSESLVGAAGVGIGVGKIVSNHAKKKGKKEE